MSKAKGESIHIVGIEAENFHRLRAAHIELQPGSGLVRVTGKNKAGKTSLLRAVAAALGGQGEVKPSAIHTDAETGRVTLRLSNGFTVERRFTTANPKGYLTVVGPDGGKYAQTKVGEWVGERSFDPLALFNLKAAQLREVFLSLGTDPHLGKKLEGLKREQAEVAEERKPWNSVKQRAERAKVPEGERPEPVDVSGEMDRLRKLREAEREREALYESWAKECEHRDREDEAARGYARRVDALKAELAVAEKALDESLLRVARAATAAEEKEKAWRAATDYSGEIAEAEARISQADAVNAALDPWREYERAQREGEDAVEKARALTDKLNKLRDAEASLLAGAGIPVPGLSFDDDGTPLLNGLPVEVASGAEKIEMAVAVAIAANPELRVCLVDEANDMDLEMLDALRAKAEEHDFQVWACRIGLEGAGEVVVDDGEARSADADEVTPEPDLFLEGVAE